MAGPVTRTMNDPAADAALLLMRVGLGLLFIILPAASVFSRRVIFVILPVGAALVFLAATLAPRRHAVLARDDLQLSPVSAGLIFLILWAGLSLLWTPFEAAAAERFLKSAGTGLVVALAIVFLPGRTRSSNLNLLPIGTGLAAICAVAAALLGLAMAKTVDMGSSTLERSVVMLILLVWPTLAALGIRDRWAMAGVVAVAVSVAAVAAWSPVALTAMALGALTFAISVSKPQQTAKWIGLVLAALFVLGPVLPFVLKLFAGARGAEGAFAPMFVWSEIVQNEGLRLITGHGLDSSARGILQGYLPLRTPRTILFEVWYDLGLLGALGSAWLAYFAALSAGRATHTLAPFLLAGLVSGIVIPISGLSTAQLWWLSAIGLAAISFALVARGQYRTRRPLAKVVDNISLDPAR